MDQPFVTRDVSKINDAEIFIIFMIVLLIVGGVYLNQQGIFSADALKTF